MTAEEPADDLRPYWTAAKRVEQDLRKRVASGAWGAGAILPGRRQMAAEYGIDVNTLQRAMKPLIAEKLLRVDIGRGTFIDAKPHHESRIESSKAWKGKTSTGRPVTLGILSGQTLDAMDIKHDTDVWDYIIVHGIESEFSAHVDMHSRYCSLLSTGQASISIDNGISSLLEAGADVLAVILPQEPIDTEAVVDALRNSGVPSVLLSFHALSLPISQVSYDSRFAGHQAAQHLLRQGYRDLLFFSPFRAAWVLDRIAGAGDAVHLEGMTADSLSISTRDETLDPARCDQETVALKAAAHWMHDLPVAAGLGRMGVIAANDYVAAGFMRAASGHGWEAGIDYGIVGFDDRPWARALGLTSLHPPIEGMGREAARLLMNALAGEPMPMQVCLRSHLIPRKSSRPVALSKKR